MAKATLNVDEVIKNFVKEMAAERGQNIEQFIGRAVANEAKRTAAAITDSAKLDDRLKKILAVVDIADRSPVNKRQQAIRNIKLAHRKRSNKMQMRERRAKEASES